MPRSYHSFAWLPIATGHYNVYIREYVANTRNLLDECYFSSVTDTMGEWLLISFGW